MGHIFGSVELKRGILKFIYANRRVWHRYRVCQAATEVTDDKYVIIDQFFSAAILSEPVNRRNTYYIQIQFDAARKCACLTTQNITDLHIQYEKNAWKAFWTNYRTVYGGERCCGYSMFWETAIWTRTCMRLCLTNNTPTSQHSQYKLDDLSYLTNQLDSYLCACSSKKVPMEVVAQSNSLHICLPRTTIAFFFIILTSAAH